jgi:hypothetical protein
VAADDRGVGVHDLAEQELRPNADNFGLHGRPIIDHL